MHDGLVLVVSRDCSPEFRWTAWPGPWKPRRVPSPAPDRPRSSLGAARTAPVLPDGLVLRTSRPADLDQIGALLAARGEDEDAVDHRLVVQDPDLGWEACAVVVDGDRVVSTATLLDESVRVGDVVLPAGQIELVATDPAYEGRGLVRALMAWAHARSAERGHLLQVIIGIPYFYRRFGYEYAIEIPPARRLSGPVVPGTVGGEAEHGLDRNEVLRPAEPRDLPTLAALQQAAQSRYDVALPHPAARWRWLLEHSASRTVVLERDRAVVASARLWEGDGELLLAEPTAVDPQAARGLLALATADRSTVNVVHRAGTTTGEVWEGLLDAPGDAAEQYYVRIADPAVVLDALRPVLHRRMLDAGIERFGDELVLSAFGAHHRMAVTAEGLGQARAGGPMQSPGAVGGIGVAPDQLGALLLGRGFLALSRLRPDVYAADRELAALLFPPMSADLLTYYLPW